MFTQRMFTPNLSEGPAHRKSIIINNKTFQKMKRFYTSFARTMLTLVLAMVSSASAFADEDNNDNPYLTSEKIPYVDEKGETKYIDRSQVTVLTGDETVLTSGWYIPAKNLITYNHPLRIDGTVKIIALRRTSKGEDVSSIEFYDAKLNDEPAVIYGTSKTDSLCLYVHEIWIQDERFKYYELDVENYNSNKVFDIAHIVNYGQYTYFRSKKEDIATATTMALYNGSLHFNSNIDFHASTDVLNLYGGFIYFHNSKTEAINTFNVGTIENFAQGYADFLYIRGTTFNYTGVTKNVNIPDRFVCTDINNKRVSYDIKTTDDLIAALNENGGTIYWDKMNVWKDNEDNSAAFETEMYDFPQGTLGRTFAAGYYNTFSVPFYMNTEMMDDAFGAGNWTLKALTGADFDSETLSLTFSDFSDIYSAGGEGCVIANYPYLLLLKEEVKNPFISGIIVNEMYADMMLDGVSSVAKPSYNGVSFVATGAAPAQVGAKGDDIESMLFLGANNTLYHPSSMPATIKAFRAYFLLEEPVYQAAKRITLNIDNEATSIDALADDAIIAESGEWFTLQGTKLAGKPAKAGVYVNNGKKVIIK